MVTPQLIAASYFNRMDDADFKQTKVNEVEYGPGSDPDTG
jgi:hypothetical protein